MTYDGLYRLASENIANAPGNKNGVVSYGLDPVGNRSTDSSSLSGVPSGSWSYNADDEASSESYDQNGNAIAAGGKAFTYDSQNEMTSMTGGGTAVGIVYDGDGNRVAKSVNGVVARYLVDDLNPTGLPQVVEELIGSGVVTRTYTYGLQRIGEDQVVSNAWTPSFYGYDGMGNVRQLTNSTGAISDEYEYDAFGNKFTVSGTTANNYFYRGEQWDPDLGLYYLRARYYNPLTGRFLSKDPYPGETYQPKTLHRYQYTGADPVNDVDPSGNAAIVEAALDISYRVGRTVTPVVNLGLRVLCLYNTIASGIELVDQPSFMHLLNFGYNAASCEASGEFAETPEEPAPPEEEPPSGGGAEEGISCPLCFAAGTPVHTDRGDVPIEKIQVGDEVIARNSKTGDLEKEPVTALVPKHQGKLLDIRVEGEHDPLRPSKGHPFWTRRGDSVAGQWIEAESLRLGDLLETADGNWRRITGITPVANEETVYNFTVDKDHDYFVGQTGFLVHNSEGCGCKFALGKREGLRNWANKLDLDHFLGPENWKQLFLDQVANPGAQFHVNLSGFPGISQGVPIQGAVEAEIGLGTNTGWELQQLRDAGRLPEAKFYLPGELNPTCSPFE